MKSGPNPISNQTNSTNEPIPGQLLLVLVARRGLPLGDLLGGEGVELLHRDQVNLLVLRLELLALGHLRGDNK